MSDRGEVKTTLNMRPFYSFSLTLADRMPLALQTRRLRMSLRSSVHGAPVVDHVPSQADALVLRELQDAEKEKRRVQRRLKQLLAGPTAANMRREQVCECQSCCHHGMDYSMPAISAFSNLAASSPKARPIATRQRIPHDCLGRALGRVMLLDIGRWLSDRATEDGA